MEYQVIYADPPWRYTPAVKNRRIENHYPTMTTTDIKALQVPSAPNSVLYLWATTAKLPECFEVMKAWGFNYITSMVWDKQKIGMGYWYRGQHEFLLVGTKGKFSPPKPADRISSVWSEKRTRHSKKPAGIRDLIKKWFPTASRLELFCRYPSPGWHVWGNEVNSDIELKNLAV